MKFSLSTGRALALPALMLALASSAFAAEGWETNFEKAKTAAAKDNKDLLIDFTGSDWCGWCIKLNKEVFDKDAFKQDAPKHFVLVELDYPQKKEQSAEIKEQNKKLQETYTIEGFPTILLTDAKGRPYAKTGYQEGGPEAYNEHLTELRKVRESRDAAFKKAEGLEGVEKAKALHEGLKELEPDLIAAHYKAEVDQIVALDKDDVTGVKRAAAVREKRVELDTKLEALRQEKKVEEFEKAIDDFIAAEKLAGGEKQEMLMNKLSVYGPEKLDAADALMDEVIKIDEKSDVGESAKKIKERIVSMREEVKKSKEEPKDKGDRKAE